MCGVIFERIPLLDVFELGVYWDTIKDAYPHRQLQPALIDQGAPLDLSLLDGSRAQLTSTGSGEFVQQIQSDRFYLNWRRRGAEYPHFTAPEAGGKGIRTLVIEAFERFSAFCEARPTLATRPLPTRVELVKIDEFVRGETWGSLDELARLLPVTATFTTIRESERIRIALQEHEEFEDGLFTIRINSTPTSGELGTVRVESRTTMSLAGQPSMQHAFDAANIRLNRAFFALVPEAERYFGTLETP